MRNVLFYKHYFIPFYNAQPAEAQKKIEWILGVIREWQWVPVKFFKSIRGSEGLYEIRIQSSNRSIRIFCFFDPDNTLVLLNGIVKKRGRIPRQSLQLAQILKREYRYETTRKH